MNSIVNDLNRALAQRLLVNVYQTTQDVVYTGYVTAVGETGIALATYDDYGLADGAVFLDLKIVDEVEFASDDLDNMAFRIQTAQIEHFNQVGGQTLKLDGRRDIRGQILSQAWVDQLVIMLVLRNDNRFYEGQVTSVVTDQVTIKLLNKFDYSDQPTLHVNPADIEVIEFQGQELSLQGSALPQLKKLQHVEQVALTDEDVFRPQLQELAEKDKLVALIPQHNHDMFFVGRINVVAGDSVIMNLVDMTGQFGGYTLTRIDALHAIVLESDYLQTVSLFTEINQSSKQHIQPVLNDERLFDPTEEQFSSRLTQAATFQTVIRVKAHKGDSMLGYPSDVGAERFIFHELEDNQLDQVGKVLRIADIEEIDFGYLDAYLVEHQLRVEGEI